MRRPQPAAAQHLGCVHTWTALDWCSLLEQNLCRTVFAAGKLRSFIPHGMSLLSSATDGQPCAERRGSAVVCVVPKVQRVSVVLLDEEGEDYDWEAGCQDQEPSIFLDLEDLANSVQEVRKSLTSW